MTDPICIDVADDAVWMTTVRAVEASSRVPATLTIRCSQCQSELGQAGVVPHYGPLFMSWWSAPKSSRTVVNGAEYNERQLHAYEAAHPHTEVVKDRGQVDGRDGVIALLRLHATLPEQYPALLVRCRRHGDAVLDRSEVLDALGAKSSELQADVTLPTTSYLPPRSDLLDGTSRRTRRVTRKIGARPQSDDT